MPLYAISEVENVFEFLIQSNTENQRQLCRRIKLPRLNGTDRVS